ncbi:lysophosphatidic acid receptor 6-like [Gadus morhua]|uniref:Lysophosphatidic acid receptor 6-like n=1 Tax=Gadus morhua TaxID=8049 RepID=A0A8C4ZKA2_GADMO|nr:lysophosphatidic acid receptor 6-like [Gadus morhua]
MSSAEEGNMAYAVIFGCIVVLGLPLNAASLWILIQRHRLKSPSAVIMINLALADLLLVLSLPMRVYYYATGIWSLGVFACICISSLFTNNIRASAIFITVIGVDRLLAVVFPLSSRHLRNTTNSWRACGLIWISLVAVSIPESVAISSKMQGCNLTNCFHPERSPCYKEQIVPSLNYVNSCFVFTLLAVNCISTSMVSWKLRSHLSDSVQVVNKMNVMLIFAMNLLMFFIFFLPVSLVLSVEKWRVAVEPALCLASMNCCFDPLLYYFSLDSFWTKKEDDKARPNGIHSRS